MTQPNESLQLSDITHKKKRRTTYGQILNLMLILTSDAMTSTH